MVSKMFFFHMPQKYEIPRRGAPATCAPTPATCAPAPATLAREPYCSTCNAFLIMGSSWL
jgi:hypothetical protein